jgi:hypothetical protein
MAELCAKPQWERDIPMKTPLVVSVALCLFTIHASAAPTLITVEWDLYPNETTATVYGRYAFLASIDQDPEYPSLNLPYECEDATRKCWAHVNLEAGTRTISLRSFRRSDGVMGAPSRTIVLWSRTGP